MSETEPQTQPADPPWGLACALSLLIPVTSSLKYTETYCASYITAGVMLSIAPALCLYLGVYSGRIADLIDNDMRRLDQSAQVVACVFLAYAFTESVPFCLTVALFCIYPVFSIWEPETTNDGRRWEAVGTMIICAHLGLIVVRCDVWDFAYLLFLIIAPGHVCFNMGSRAGIVLFHIATAIWLWEAGKIANENCNSWSVSL